MSLGLAKNLSKRKTSLHEQICIERIDEANSLPRTQTEHMEANDTPCQQVAELQREYERLSLEKDQYLQTLNNSEALKLQLRETRKDAKHLSKQKKKLQAMTDIGKPSEETSDQPPEDRNPRGENPFALEPIHTAPQETFPSREQTYSLPSQESFSPPSSPQDSGMNGHISPVLPTSNGFAKVEKPFEWGTLDAKTEANALRIENRDLVRMKRKQEEQVRNMSQELVVMGTRCKELENIAQRLEAENQRLSQQLGLVHSNLQRGDQYGPNEEVQLLRAQLKLYEDDFKKERSEKEQLITQKERLKRELSDSNATVAGLQRQLKQALNGEGGYGDPRGARVAIMSEPYVDPYALRHPLDYGMARSYSGGYIGPGASNTVLRRGQTPYPKKAFLSPDMTAVIDRDVVDGPPTGPPKSI